MSIFFKKEKPFIEDINLNKIIKKIDTPFYIYSQKIIIDNYKKLKLSLDSEIFFSVKANSNLAILTLMKSLGSGADVVSNGELIRALSAGFPASKIIYEGVGKSKNDIKFAIKKNIRQINVESIEELKLINSLGQYMKKNVNIGIRINPNINSNTIDKITTGRKTDKFGISINKLNKICLELKKLNNVNLKGISCHVGSQISDSKIFDKVFIKMKNAADLFEKKGLVIENLDLGGGFGISYNGEKEINLNQLSKIKNKIFKNKNYKISFEPGRYLVAKSGSLITKILTYKKNSTINYLITDAGMHTFLRPAMYKSFHKILSFKKKGVKETYTIAGPICESSDILAKNIKLPKQKSGNYLAICDTGAYGFVMASNYNSNVLPSEVLIYKNKFQVIRKKENILKFIKKDIIPKWLKN